MNPVENSRLGLKNNLTVDVAKIYVGLTKKRKNLFNQQKQKFFFKFYKKEHEKTSPSNFSRQNIIAEIVKKFTVQLFKFVSVQCIT